MLRRILLFLVWVVLAVLLAACGGGVQADVFPEEAPTPIPMPAAATPPIPTPEPVIVLSPPEGYVVSRLTGLYIREELADSRPFAVVFNNEINAMPQMGLAQADIFYEVLTEGSITRLIAIFQDFDAEMLGPVRSTREYFTHFALEHGAIMVHHGGSVAGYNAIRNHGVAAVDGMRFDGSVFWRDAARRRDRGLEHSSFTSAQNLFDVAEQLDFNMTATENLGLFEFFEELTAPAPQNLAHTVRVPFSGTNVAVFEYNPEDNLYYKYIFGAPQLDYAAGQQMAVANVIVQITDISHIPGDAAGRRNVQLVGSGRGYLATNGTYAEISWVRESAAASTRWYDADGEPLTVNVGRTWILVVNNQPTFEGPAQDEHEEYDDDSAE